MRIPDVADRLRVLAAEQGLSELEVLAGHLKRRRTVRKAPPVSAQMTPELAERVRAYAVAHPRATQVAIGRVFNLNQGRVSEALRGKRQ